MPVTAIDVVNRFARSARPAYVQAFQQGDALLAAAGIDSGLRLAHFMAQCLHETDGLTIFVESGAYTARNLGDMWDQGNWHRYFRDRAAMVAMAAQCRVDKGEALFNLVYSSRMGNGPPASGDGWKYRGRGILQTTGREAYHTYGVRCRVDFEGDPDLVVDPAHALKPALAEWTEKHLNIAADNDDIEVVTKGINGGTVGMPSRRAWLAKVKPFILEGRTVQKTIEWRVQVALNAAGFDCGEPDGVVGPNTRSAIMAYRVARGLSPRTDISEDLIRSLGL